MNQRLVMTLVAAVALGGCLWLLGADEWLGLRRHADDSTGGQAGVSSPGAGADAAAAAGAGRGAPVLFGRPEGVPRGPGSLSGRVMDFAAGQAVKGAQLLLSGSAAGGDAVALRAVTDAHGRFRLASVPAGDAYAFHVQADGLPARVLDGIYVPGGAENDLGDVWLGGKGVFEGRVVNADGRAVAGAQIRLHSGEGSIQELLRDFGELFASLDRESAPKAAGESGPDGRFRIPGVDPGMLTVLVRAPGFTQAMVRAAMTPDGVAGGQLVITLSAMEPVSGIVVDDAGRGVAGARVALFEKEEIASVLYGRVFTQTGSDGRFVLHAPPPGDSYAWIAAAEGHLTAMGEARAGDKELRMVLAGGAELLIRLQAAERTQPVVGAAITVLYGEEADLAGAGMASGVSDERGELRLRARPGPVQMIHVSHAALGGGIYAPRMSAMMGMASAVQGPEQFEIEAGSNTLSLTLGTGLTVTGLVRDRDGKPLAGARCSVIGMLGMGGEGLSDAQGRYEFRTGAPPNIILAALPGYVQVLDQETLMQMGGEPTRDEQGRYVIDLVMEPAAAIAGRVLDEDGRPLAGVQVRAKDSEASFMYMLGAGERTTTNAAGRYLLDGVRPSEAVRVAASREGLVSASSEPFAVLADGVTQAPDIKLSRGTTLSVRVNDVRGAAAKGARVQIHVQRADGYQDAMDLMDMQRGTFADRVVGSDGTLRVEAIPAGTITITATAAGSGGARHVHVLGERAPDAPAEIVLALRPGSAFRGRVLGAQGQPLAGALVRIQGSGDLGDGPVSGLSSGRADAPAVTSGPVADWMPSRTARSNEQGRFEIADLPDGALQVSITCEGHMGHATQWQGARDGAEFRLEARAPGAAARLEEIDQQLMAIYQAMSAAKDEDERKALQQELARLSTERQRLSGSDD